MLPGGEDKSSSPGAGAQPTTRLMQTWADADVGEPGVKLSPSLQKSGTPDLLCSGSTPGEGPADGRGGATLMA